MRAQQGFGTAESCSLSSPTTSTKRQLSSTPRLLINWTHTQAQTTDVGEEIAMDLKIKNERKAISQNDDRQIPPSAGCLKMLRWPGTATPFSPDSEISAGERRMLRRPSAFPGGSRIPSSLTNTFFPIKRTVVVNTPAWLFHQPPRSWLVRFCPSGSLPSAPANLTVEQPVGIIS